MPNAATPLVAEELPLSTHSHAKRLHKCTFAPGATQEQPSPQPTTDFRKSLQTPRSLKKGFVHANDYQTLVSDSTCSAHAPFGDISTCLGCTRVCKLASPHADMRCSLQVKGCVARPGAHMPPHQSTTHASALASHIPCDYRGSQSLPGHSLVTAGKSDTSWQPGTHGLRPTRPSHPRHCNPGELLPCCNPPGQASSCCPPPVSSSLINASHYCRTTACRTGRAVRTGAGGVPRAGAAGRGAGAAAGLAAGQRAVLPGLGGGGAACPFPSAH